MAKWGLRQAAVLGAGRLQALQKAKELRVAWGPAAQIPLVARYPSQQLAPGWVTVAAWEQESAAAPVWGRARVEAQAWGPVGDAAGVARGSLAWAVASAPHLQSPRPCRGQGK